MRRHESIGSCYGLRDILQMKKTALLFIPFLSACAAQGPAYNEAAITGGSLVVYRPTGITGGLLTWDIDVNGTTDCALHNGSFYVTDKHNGEAHLASSLFSAPGTSRIDLDLNPNETTFVKIEIDGAKSTANVLGGAAGMFAAEGMASTGGPFVFTHVNAAQAKREMATLKQDCL